VSVEGGSDEVRQFERHVLVYLDDLYRAALHLTGQGTEAEDLVQETCVRAFKALDRLKRLKRRSAVKMWVFSILRSTLLRQVVRGSVRGTLASVHDIAGSLPTPADALLDACQSVLPIRQSLPQETRDAILKLPLPYREAIILAHIGSFSYREMAQVLALPVGTVMSRLFRARRMLRAYLAERVSRDADDVPAPLPARFPADHGSR
jgi:RNA polymerase sigma-70 factor, ECF subfamily